MSELVPAGGATLDALAVAIRREVDAAEADFQSAVTHAVRAGELLTEAKAQVAHGEWLPWLAANCPLGEREAQNYMRLARNPQRVADLSSVREAIALLTAPKVDAPKVDAPTDDVKAEARRLVAERCREHGHPVEGHLYEAEVAIQTALLHERRAAEALLRLASMFATGRPSYAVACAELAAVYLDTESEPWDQVRGEAEERYQRESHELHVALGLVGG